MPYNLQETSRFAVVLIKPEIDITVDFLSSLVFYSGELTLALG